MTSVVARLSLFGVGLVVVFTAAFGVGRAVAPADEPPSAPVPDVTTTTTPVPSHDMDPGMEMGS